jgi:hypothetical protein
VIYVIAYNVRLDPETAASHVEDARREAEIEEHELSHA